MNQMTERVNCRFRVWWRELKGVVEEKVKVAEKELGWNRGWFVG